MAIYFSSRAAKELLDYEEGEQHFEAAGTGSAELNLGFFKLQLPFVPWKRRFTRSERLLKAAHRYGREIVPVEQAKEQDLVNISLRNIAYGAVKTMGIGGSQEPFTIFLFAGEAPRLGISPSVSVMGVGSVDNYSRYVGDESAFRGTWFPSSPEGRAEIYRREGILTAEERDREFHAWGLSMQAEVKTGHQVELFEDLLGSLNHNHMSSEVVVDNYRQSLKKAKLIGVVEDSRESDQGARSLLVRPILIDGK
ncbi:hypothetical protein [Arthrobacter sp. zg-Y1116]|uniref:hypothetical protein n=1 Tax=Arthrobacter sp. zg-Y1116 TaxID=2964611 RepID=UPI002103C999|nr:hypothetical protein [Arthrobacter sp. zg-Y1116]MCQ1947643.1 hypothetical protein [Arthrobacter sp. zg-Y1116]